MLKLLKEKQVRNALISLALVLATAGLVAAPDQAIAGAKDGLALCFNVIVPSLFPFLCCPPLWWSWECPGIWASCWSR